MSVQEPAHSKLGTIFVRPSVRSASLLNSTHKAPLKTFLDRFFASDTDLSSSKTVFSIAVTLAFLCAMWAVSLDVAYPIAVTAGFCTMAAIVCTYAGMLAVLNLSPNNSQSKVKAMPSVAWRQVNCFRISDASRLWCDIEPGCPASQESLAWTRAMTDAIKRGELPVSPKMGDSDEFRERERVNPSWRTEIERDDLFAWARAHGHTPPFLHR